MKDKNVVLTTVDNPYDPIDDFDRWYQFDVQKGYNSCAYLARVASLPDSLSDAEYIEEKERAIDSIVKWNPLLYKKVLREKAL